MDDKQMAEMQKEIEALLSTNKANPESIAAIVDKFSKATGQKVSLEYKLDRAYIDVGGKQQPIALAGWCLRIPCPTGGFSCYVRC